MKSRSILLAVVVMTLAAGCGKSEAPQAAAQPTAASTTPTTTPTPEPTTTTTQAGPEAFVTWAKAADLGDRDMSQATEDQLLSVGTSACEVLATQPSFGKAVEVMTKELKSMNATAGEMDAWFRQAVTNLCPQHKDMVP